MEPSLPQQLKERYWLWPVVVTLLLYVIAALEYAHDLHVLAVGVRFGDLNYQEHLHLCNQVLFFTGSLEPTLFCALYFLPIAITRLFKKELSYRTALVAAVISVVVSPASFYVLVLNTSSLLRITGSEIITFAGVIWVLWLLLKTHPTFWKTAFATFLCIIAITVSTRLMLALGSPICLSN